MEILPFELVYNITRFLPIPDILRMGRVNRFFRDLRWNWSMWACLAYDTHKFPLSSFTETDLNDPVQRYRQIAFVLSLRRNPSEFLSTAAITGNVALVKFVLSLDRSYINAATTLAAQSGHRAVVDYLLSAGAEYPEFVIREACAAGQLEIVQDLVTRPITVSTITWNACICCAACYGHEAVASYLLTLSEANLEGIRNASIEASVRGQMSTLRILIPRINPENFNYLLAMACRQRHSHVVRYFLDHFLSNLSLEGPVCEAAAAGDLESVTFLLQAGATNREEAIRLSVSWGHAKLFWSLTQDDLEVRRRFIALATAEGQRKFIREIQELLRYSSTDSPDNTLDVEITNSPRLQHHRTHWISGSDSDSI